MSRKSNQSRPLGHMKVLDSKVLSFNIASYTFTRFWNSQTILPAFCYSSQDMFSHVGYKVLHPIIGHFHKNAKISRDYLVAYFKLNSISIFHLYKVIVCAFYRDQNMFYRCFERRSRCRSVNLLSSSSTYYRAVETYHRALTISRQNNNFNRVLNSLS